MSADAWNAVSGGFPASRYTTPATMSNAPGISTPAVAPVLERKVDHLEPFMFSSVQPHSSTLMNTNTNSLFSASAGLTINAMAVAMNVMTAGNQGMFCTHCMKMARKPHFAPKASLTHRNTPPFCCQPEASSADTSADGMKNRSAPTIR